MKHIILTVIGLVALLNITSADEGCVSTINYTQESLSSSVYTSNCQNQFYDATRKIPYRTSGTRIYIHQGFAPTIEEEHTIQSQSILNNSSCTFATKPNSYMLSGNYLIILKQALNYTPLSSRIFISEVLSDVGSEEIIEIDERDLPQVRTALKSGINYLIPGSSLMFSSYPKYFHFSNGPVSTVTSYSGSKKQNTFEPSEVRTEVERALKANEWKNYEVGFIQINGLWFTTILKQFGERKISYAPYGQFTDADEAKEYGYTVKDKLFYSKQSIEPSPNPEVIPEMPRYGGTIYSYEDLTGPRFKDYKDDIPWQDECRHSGMEFVSDDFNNVVPSLNGVANEKGFITPVGPDNPLSSNPISLRGCPDHFFYWSLFKTCLENLYKDYNPVPDATERVTYEDYLKDKMGRESSWQAFNHDGTPYESDVDRGVFPETPAYYDKSGDRLNPNSDLMVYDPFHPDVTFYGRDYVWDWGFNISGGEWKERKRDLTPFLRPKLNEMKALYNQFVQREKLGLLSFYNLNSDYHGDNLSFTNKFGSLTLTLNIEKKEYFKNSWKLLNPVNKYLPYSDAINFIVNSNTGVPYRLKWESRDRNVIELAFEDRIKFLNFTVYWKYDIFTTDKYGDIYKIGDLYIESLVYRNIIDGPEVNYEHTEFVYSKGPDEALISGNDKYDLESRSALTDLKGLSERDDLTFEQKMSAIGNIALHIAVSEGLDMAMKWIHKNQPYYYQLASKAENWTALMVTAKIVYTLYKAYREWALLMDIMADVRDTYKDLERAYARVKKSSGLLFNHYVNLDYKSIRPTNITKLYPARSIRYFDYTLWDLEHSLLRFENSIHALAFDVDRFTHGPGKLVLAYIQKNAFDNLGQSQIENEKLREINHKDLQSTSQSARGKDSPSDHLRLSKYTQTIIDKTKAIHVKSLYSSTSGLQSVLIAIQSDSRDWITMGDYVTENLAGGPGAFVRAKRDRSPQALINQFDVPMVFRNKWVDDKVAEMEGNP